MNDAATATTLPPPIDLETTEPAADAAGLRTDEVRNGMSLTWVRTWPVMNGYAWHFKGRGAAGWMRGDRYDALRAARAELRVRQEATERVDADTWQLPGDRARCLGGGS